MSGEGGFSFGKKTVEEFLEELASGAAVPGGGSAAALGAATGAALVSMACRLTLGREKYREHEGILRKALVAADDLRVEAVKLAAEDAMAYSIVMGAHSLPKPSEEEASTRSKHIEDALKSATEVQLRTVALAARILELCARIVDVANPNATADLGVGALMAQSALDGAALNVRTNVALIKDEAFRVVAIEQLGGYLHETAALAETVLEAADSQRARLTYPSR